MRTSTVVRRSAFSGAAALLACGLWNSVKPMPPGTHISSLPVRLADPQAQFLDEDLHPGTIGRHEVEAVARAERTIVLERCPLRPDLADALLLRKRQRPTIKIMLLTDPRDRAGDGTPPRLLSALERAGVVVVRTQLDRLRDPDPYYSSLWRLTVAWWSSPFEETRSAASTLSALRRRNHKTDDRALLVADDGIGGWTSIVLSAAAPSIGMALHTQLARDIVLSVLQVAAWSTDDDRLPAPPPVENHGVGTIDARLLTEGAIGHALRDSVAAAGRGDSIDIDSAALDDWPLIEALTAAAARGAGIRLMLDPTLRRTRAAAGAVIRGRNIQVRWAVPSARDGAQLAIFRHFTDVWMYVGSAGLTRSTLEDFNLAADVELHMPHSAGAAHDAGEFFERQWAMSVPYADYAYASTDSYYRYRLEAATGLNLF
ncbi:MAG: hypothetical protein M3O06_00925 [Pseudomonadota bacterium]|nr:hypothetical protein [Pseudomonadota bacterium]